VATTGSGKTLAFALPALARVCALRSAAAAAAAALVRRPTYSDAKVANRNPRHGATETVLQ
jgi:superfamily II DNA/RNA helicase